MDALLQGANNTIPGRDVVCSIAEKFSASPSRAGKIVVQPKQVWNWFQNRRYAQKAKLIKTPGKLSVSSMPRDDSALNRNLPHCTPLSSGRNHFDNNARVEFEAKSARDGAWYDVATFVSHRMFETGDPEVRVRFAGFGAEEDEWVNVRKHVRPCSVPCEASECVAVLPGDLILCFQEGKEQALYLDAHVLDAQRWRHDVRGCRCRFLVRYDHDQSEEIVPLRKVCRRPETDYRLQLMYASKEFASVDLQEMSKDPSLVGTSRDFNSTPVQKIRKHHKPKGNADEVVTIITSSSVEEPIIMETATATTMKAENCDDNNIGISDERIVDAALVVGATTSIGSGSGSGTGNGTGTGTVKKIEEGK
ncbi:hypothetical protein BVC80_1485g32 [Macleaya cordata]|uniref:SAWADEE domain-containing protein n=1 Tax=Macleaya cordata TaxID=56857 RepID=A0A200QNK7_MACCD|nr:hypothetical protein BVC80_1485g32 [Macleaya cordata]